MPPRKKPSTTPKVKQSKPTSNATQKISKNTKKLTPYIQATCEETFGKECYDEDFWEDYNKNTAKEKNNQKET